MKPDPIIEEIYEARGQLLDRFHGDLTALMNYYRETQAQHAERLVTKEMLLERKAKQAATNGNG